MTLPTEAEITKRIIRTLRKRGAYVLKVHGSERQPKTVDLVACIGGQFIGIEVKRPGKQPTERQQFTLNSISKAGGWAIVATSEKQLAPIEVLELNQSYNGVPIRENA